VSLHTRIKEYRRRLDLTQEQLATAVGVRRETVVFLEAGKYNPSLKLAMDIASRLGGTVEEIFSYDE
jgi:putative transcriptional regulator